MKVWILNKEMGSGVYAGANNQEKPHGYSLA